MQIWTVETPIKNFLFVTYFHTYYASYLQKYEIIFVAFEQNVELFISSV